MKKIQILLIGCILALCSESYIIADEVNKYPRIETPTEPELIRMSHDSVVCVIENKGSNYRILEGEDALRLESYLKEFDNSWVSEAGFWQILNDIGCWDYPRTAELGKIRVYKNGQKMYDLRIVWLALYKPGKEKSDGQFLWLHWDEPLSNIIHNTGSIERERAAVRRRVDPLPWPAWNGCIRYNAEEVENGPIAQFYHLSDYIEERAESKDEADQLISLLKDEVGKDVYVRKKAPSLNLGDRAGCLMFLRLKGRALQGDLQAQYELGETYMSGGIIRKNILKGKEFIKIAAKQGHVKANERLKEIVLCSKDLDAKIRCFQNNIKDIYDIICRGKAEVAGPPTDAEKGEYQHELVNRILESRNIICSLKTGSNENEVRATEKMLVYALYADKSDDKLLVGWMRADIPNVRVAYLLAYYILYGDKADLKYQELKKYINHFADDMEREEEILQVQFFIDSLNAQPHRGTGESFNQ